MRAQHTHRQDRTPSRGSHPTVGEETPPTGKAVGWGGGLGRNWGELRPGGQRRCAPGPGTATGEVAQPEAPGPGRGSEPGSATGRGAGVRRCLSFLPTGRAGAAFRAGHCGTECGARFPGSPRYCRPAAPGPWHRAPSVSNRKSLTTGRSIDPSIPPASGRQECPDPPSLSPERLRGNRPGPSLGPLAAPCPLAAPAHLRARALSSGPPHASAHARLPAAATRGQVLAGAEADHVTGRGAGALGECALLWPCAPWWRGEPRRGSLWRSSTPPWIRAEALRCHDLVFRGQGRGDP